MRSEIDDAGETIPYAHKHRSNDAEVNEGKAVCLADFWPEPDWKLWIDEGRPCEVVAKLAVLYSGFASRPKSGMKECSARDWQIAFERAAPLIRDLFERARTVADVERMPNDLACAAGFELPNLPNLSLRDLGVQVFLALGRGSRRLRGPFNLTLRQLALATWLPDLGWPENAHAFDSAIVPVKLTDGTWAVGRVEGNRYTLLAEKILTRAEALESARQHIAKGTSAVGAGRAARAREIERVGADHRKGRDVTPEELMGVFGFRGIQFGESLGQAERQLWVNELYDALHDLAAFLGLKPRWIGLKGLALAVGARGVGRALAHYEPGLRCFNYTRKRGAGSVAHEWWHALDAYLVQWVNPSYFRLADGYLSLHDWAFPAASHPSAPKLLPALREILSFTGRTGQASEFLRDAWKIAGMPRQGEYWYQRHEMIARAFEAYVQDGLAARGQISPYLVLGTSQQEMAEEDADLRAYPVGEERLALNGYFDAIFAALRGIAPAGGA